MHGCPWSGTPSALLAGPAPGRDRVLGPAVGRAGY